MTCFAPLGLHRCRLIMAAVVGSWLMVDVRPALAQPDASPLPSFDFRQAGAAQSRNPSDINPGTLQPLALRLLAGDRPAAIPYEFHAFRSSGLWVHAPGAVEAIRDQPGSAHFTVKAWSPRPSFVVIHGLHPTGKQGPASRAA